jgi:hypothetical protein
LQFGDNYYADIFKVRYHWRFYSNVVKMWAQMVVDCPNASCDPSNNHGQLLVKGPKFVAGINGVTAPSSAGFKRMAIYGDNNADANNLCHFTDTAANVSTVKCGVDSRTAVPFDYGGPSQSAAGNYYLGGDNRRPPQPVDGMTNGVGLWTDKVGAACDSSDCMDNAVPMPTCCGAGAVNDDGESGATRVRHRHQTHWVEAPGGQESTRARAPGFRQLIRSLPRSDGVTHSKHLDALSLFANHARRFRPVRLRWPVRFWSSPAFIELVAAQPNAVTEQSPVF